MNSTLSSLPAIHPGTPYEALPLHLKVYEALTAFMDGAEMTAEEFRERIGASDDAIGQATSVLIAIGALRYSEVLA